MSFAIRGRIGSFYGVTGSMLGAPYGSLGGPGGVSWAARGRVLCYLGTHRVVLWGHLLYVGGCLGQLGRSGGAPCVPRFVRTGPPRAAGKLSHVGPASHTTTVTYVFTGHKQTDMHATRPDRRAQTTLATMMDCKDTVLAIVPCSEKSSMHPLLALAITRLTPPIPFT